MNDSSIKNKSRALKYERSDYEFLVENMTDIVFQVTLSGKFTYINPSCYRMAGYTQDEMIGKNFARFVPKSELPRYLGAMRRMISGEKIDSFVSYVIHNNGELVPAEFSGQLVKYGRKRYFNGILKNIAERQKAEQEIRNAHQHLQHIIDSASELVFTISVDYKIKTWNASIEKLSGYSRKEVLGKSIKHLQIFENVEEILENINQVFHGRPFLLNEISIFSKYYQRYILSISPSFLRDSQGNITEILFVCHDLTTKKDEFDAVEFGHSYIIVDKSRSHLMHIFNNYLSLGTPGLFISRMNKRKIHSFFKDQHPEIIELVDISEDINGKNIDIYYLLKQIESFIMKHKESVIVIDRIDFLSTLYSFETTMKYLYEINSLIPKYESILLLRANPKVYSEQELSLLKEEFEAFPSKIKDSFVLMKDHFHILFFVAQHQNSKIQITYTEISKKCSLSKITVRKRVLNLIDMGLVYQKNIGRAKCVFITKKGKEILKKYSQHQNSYDIKKDNTS